jgi:hypothetical protein
MDVFATAVRRRPGYVTPVATPRGDNVDDAINFPNAIRYSASKTVQVRRLDLGNDVASANDLLYRQDPATRKAQL